MMDGFKVLNASNPEEYREWVTTWEQWPDHEVFAHPAYVRLYLRDVDLALCAVFQTARGGVMYPFILRPLSAEDEFSGWEGWYDLTTPYGYGGPYRTGDPEPESFWDCFNSWAESQRVVTSFARLSLFSQQILPFEGLVVPKSLNIVRTLDMSLEEVWQDYEHKVRKNCNHALRDGLSVEVDIEGTRLDEFLEVYYSTMERRSASQGYFFSREYFRRIIEDLPGQFAFFHTTDSRRVLSTELVLVSTSNIYSFLGGTIAETFASRPNELLKHRIVQWGIENEKKTFVLGGGYADQDGIFRYKKSFAPTGIVQFSIGTCIHNQEAYDRLVLIKRKLAASAEAPRAGFFPEYRA